MSYDAAIVGASIAGLYTAMKLSRAGWRVAVIDRRKRIGVPVRCGEATGSRAELGRFVDINESWIARDIHGLVAHVNDTRTFTREIEHTGVILHRDRFEESLAHSAAGAGAEIILETLVTGLCAGGGVRLENGNIAQARLVIGADGCESLVGQWAGLTRPLRMSEAFTSLQYTVESNFLNHGMLHFFIGSRHIPRGYLWVFPKADGRVSVGAGLYGCNHKLPKAAEFLDRFIDTYMPGTARTNLITGCVPLAVCPRKLHSRNVVLAGDAARQCNPLLASGIMNALEAADLLVTCLSAGNQNLVHRLDRYSRTWSGKPRREQKIFLLLKNVLMSMSDNDLERALSAADSAFRGPVDRSRVYSPPLLKIARVAAGFLPATLKNAGVLLE